MKTETDWSVLATVRSAVAVLRPAPRKKNVDSEFLVKSSCNSRSVGDARSRRSWNTALLRLACAEEARGARRS